MRKNLYLFRHSMKLSQAEIAQRIGCSRATYSSIECGTRHGTMAFWNKLQKAFNLTDAQKGELQAVEEEQA